MADQKKEMTEADKAWDETLNSEAGKKLLEEMAADALKDFDLGNFKPMNEKEK